MIDDFRSDKKREITEFHALDIATSKFFDARAVGNLVKFISWIKESGRITQIVIISCWKNKKSIEELRDFFPDTIARYIVDKTMDNEYTGPGHDPHAHIRRNFFKEIEFWLDCNSKANDAFIVLTRITSGIPISFLKFYVLCSQTNNELFSTKKLAEACFKLSSSKDFVVRGHVKFGESDKLSSSIDSDTRPEVWTADMKLSGVASVISGKVLEMHTIVIEKVVLIIDDPKQITSIYFHIPGGNMRFARFGLAMLAEKLKGLTGIDHVTEQARGGSVYYNCITLTTIAPYGPANIIDAFKSLNIDKVLIEVVGRCKKEPNFIPFKMATDFLQHLTSELMPSAAQTIPKDKELSPPSPKTNRYLRGLSASGAFSAMSPSDSDSLGNTITATGPVL